MAIDSISVLQSHHLVMLLREFYNTVTLSEEQCVEFLRENQLLVQAADHPPCSRCGHVMEQNYLIILSYVDRILEQHRPMLGETSSLEFGSGIGLNRLVCPVKLQNIGPEQETLRQRYIIRCCSLKSCLTFNSTLMVIHTPPVTTVFLRQRSIRVLPCTSLSPHLYPIKLLG